MSEAAKQSSQPLQAQLIIVRKISSGGLPWELDFIPAILELDSVAKLIIKRSICIRNSKRLQLPKGLHGLIQGLLFRMLGVA